MQTANIADVWYKGEDGNVYKIQGKSEAPSGITLTVTNNKPQEIEYSISVANPGSGSNLTYKILYKKSEDTEWQISDTNATGTITAGNFGNYDVKAQVINDAGSTESMSKSVEVIDSRIFGVSWNQQIDPHLTRTDSAAGITSPDEFAKVCPIMNRMKVVNDDYGNSFVRIPKFYIRKTQTTGLSTWQISLENHGDDWYLPKCFYDFDKNVELPYVDIGQFLANVNGNKLESKVGNVPTNNISIQDARQYARNNGKGYQQLDIHVVDIIQVLFINKYAVLSSQLIDNDNYHGKNGGGIEYMDIYNLTDELYQFTDGICIGTFVGQTKIYVCDDANQYSNSQYAYPYRQANFNLSGTGLIEEISHNSDFPELSLPTKSGGGIVRSNDYYGDLFWSAYFSNQQVCWGGNSDDLQNGIWYYSFLYNFGEHNNETGCRLVRKAVL